VKISLEVKAEKTICACGVDGIQENNYKKGNRWLESVEPFKYLRTTIKNQNPIHKKLKD
jgi:hypothetical protein